MVSLEFEKPSSWSMGKKLGILAVIMLLIGPFLPYVTWEYSMGEEKITDSYSYFNFEVVGFWMFIPIISAVLVLFLLYFKANIYLEQNSRRMNIKPFILMLWGFWFFLCYLLDALRMGGDFFGSSTYAGFGLWIMVIGFFLTAFVGFLEWRFPAMAGPQISIGKPKGAKAAPEKAPETVAAVEPEVAAVEPVAKKEPQKISDRVKPEPSPVTPVETKTIEAVEREPTSDEEKTLMRWARHINEEGKTFEQCMKCKNYVFIESQDKGKSIAFNCPDCGASFALKK